MHYKSAERFMDVAARFGQDDKLDKLSNLKISVLYALAAPSTPDSVISQVKSGEIPPTLDAIKKAKEAQQKAEQAREEAEQKAESAQQQLTLFSSLSEQKITELTRQITELYDQIKEIETPEAVEVTPPEVLIQIKEMQATIEQLTKERDLLSKEGVKLVANLKDLRESTQIQRDQERYAAQVKGRWKKATEALHKALVQFMGEIPPPLDLHLFEAEEWTRLDQTVRQLEYVREELKKLQNQRYTSVVPDTVEISLMEVSPHD